MLWPEIAERIAAGDNESTQLDTWDAFPRRAADTLCALANTDGGVLILGVAGDGTFAGVAEDPDQAQQELTELLREGLSMPLSASLGRHQIDGQWVHWIELRKIRYADPIRAAGRVLVRSGAATVEPSPAELQELYNLFGFILTEEQIVPGTTPSDLDLDIFDDFLHRAGLEVAAGSLESRVVDLRNKGIVTDDGQEPRLSLYGLLCFGRQPQAWPATRNAWVQLVAYAGNDRADETILTGEAKGRLDEQVERTLGWLKALGIREEYSEIERTDRTVVPLRALREAVVNAIVHRDYAILGSRAMVEVFNDRVDITSPGVLPNHSTVEAALSGGHPRTRNELTANFMTTRGLMEIRGRGLPIIRREMEAFNNTHPTLISSQAGSFVRLTLQR